MARNDVCLEDEQLLKTECQRITEARVCSRWPRVSVQQGPRYWGEQELPGCSSGACTSSLGLLRLSRQLWQVSLGRVRASVSKGSTAASTSSGH